MTILQALDGYYGRMAARNEAERPGFSREKIGFAIVLSEDGRPIEVRDLRSADGKKPKPVLMEVPAAVKRTAGIASNRLWDKTSYVLGRTAGPGRRAAEEHAAFKAAQRDLLAGTTDEGLVALLRFLDAWLPETFEAAPFSADMLDLNVVFRLDGDRGCLHEREAARQRLATTSSGAGDGVTCLVTGMRGPLQRLHPAIKGVQGAQSSGAALVSFNLDAFTSYGKEQGDNAPTSEAAAFRYGAALNRMLDRDSANRLARPIGDATVVFWADTSATVNETAAKSAEAIFFRSVQDRPVDDDPQEAVKLYDALEKVAEGRPQQADPALRPGTRFHVLGLAPNAARLSVRYWLDDSFEAFARRLLDHKRDLRIEPRPDRWGNQPPSIARLLVKTTALQEKFDNIPPLLAGEAMRAVLAGTRYPRSWLGAALIRLRAGDDPSTGWHAAVIRAVLERDRRLSDRDKGRSDDVERRTPEVPVSLDKAHPNAGYQLGRLFAIYELAQVAALGRGVKSTIRDKYFGAASATPARVFPLIVTNGQNHLSKVRKEKPGWAHLIEKELEEVMGRFKPNIPHTWPRFLRQEDQGEFAIGYYHQRRAKLSANGADQPTLDLAGEGEGDDE